MKKIAYVIFYLMVLNIIPVFANEKLIAIHTLEGGKKTVTLPVKCKEVRELYTNKVVPVKKQQFVYDFSAPDTALFEIV